MLGRGDLMRLAGALFGWVCQTHVSNFVRTTDHLSQGDYEQKSNSSFSHFVHAHCTFPFGKGYFTIFSVTKIV